MKIYAIAMFLLIVNLSIAFIVSTGILPATVATIPIAGDTFSREIPENLTYSNADIGLYLFGDFPRALGMLAKIFVMAPITMPVLMGEAGFPGSIVSMLGIILWAVYLVGIAQIVMKYSLEGNA